VGWFFGNGRRCVSPDADRRSEQAHTYKGGKHDHQVEQVDSQGHGNGRADRQGQVHDGHDLYERAQDQDNDANTDHEQDRGHAEADDTLDQLCLLYTSPSPRD